MSEQTKEQWFVYVIGISNESGSSLGAPGPKKIGYTCNLPNRLRWLQTGNPRELTIEYIAEMKSKDSARTYERRLHHVFAEQRLWGEWFDLSDYGPALERIEAKLEHLLVDEPSDLKSIMEACGRIAA